MYRLLGNQKRVGHLSLIVKGILILGSRIDQAVIDICQADWEELKTNLRITKKMIEIPSS